MPMSPYFGEVDVLDDDDDDVVMIDPAGEDEDETVFAIFKNGKLVHSTTDEDEAWAVCAAGGYGYEVQDQRGNDLDFTPY